MKIPVATTRGAHEHPCGYYMFYNDTTLFTLFNEDKRASYKNQECLPFLSTLVRPFLVGSMLLVFFLFLCVLSYYVSLRFELNVVIFVKKKKN